MLHKDTQQLREEARQADATRGRAAPQSVRELVGDPLSEDHGLEVDRFQGAQVDRPTGQSAASAQITLKVLALLLPPAVLTVTVLLPLASVGT